MALGSTAVHSQQVPLRPLQTQPPRGIPTSLENFFSYSRSRRNIMVGPNRTQRVSATPRVRTPGGNFSPDLEIEGADGPRVVGPCRTASQRRSALIKPTPSE